MLYIKQTTICIVQKKMKRKNRKKVQKQNKLQSRIERVEAAATLQICGENEIREQLF